jgi:hypothetical protein
MAKIQSNIKEFNKYVKVHWEGLKARGERCDDLMINLFKGYQAASDREFVRYINQKKDGYDDGSYLTPEQLMTFALNKNEVLTKQNDLWNAKTAEQEQIVALSAKLGKIKDVNLKLARTLQSNGKGTNKSPSEQKGKGKNKGKGKGKGKGKECKWAWKKVAPKENESKTKKLNDYMYHWCETHKAWGMHLPEACELKKQLEAEQQKSQSNDNSNQPNLTSYANALQAIITDLHDEEFLVPKSRRRRFENDSAFLTAVSFLKMTRLFEKADQLLAMSCGKRYNGTHLFPPLIRRFGELRGE